MMDRETGEVSERRLEHETDDEGIPGPALHFRGSFVHPALKPAPCDFAPITYHLRLLHATTYDLSPAFKKRA